jgi:hypothetical protein
MRFNSSLCEYLPRIWIFRMFWWRWSAVLRIPFFISLLFAFRLADICFDASWWVWVFGCFDWNVAEDFYVLLWIWFVILLSQMHHIIPICISLRLSSILLKEILPLLIRLLIINPLDHVLQSFRWRQFLFLRGCFINLWQPLNILAHVLRLFWQIRKRFILHRNW